jgi:DNA modification methylase
MVIWSKGRGGMGDLKKTLSTDYEIGLVYNRGKQIHGKRIGSVWNILGDNPNTYLHPTQKPVELAIKGIEVGTIEGQSVLDLFGGSGSTLLACEQINRICYMMEMDREYCLKTIARWEAMTGQKAAEIE